MPHLPDRAEEILLGDVDTYVNWLAEHVHRVKPIELGWVNSQPDRIEERCVKASIAELVALSLYPSKEVRYIATSHLAGRFLFDHGAYLALIESDLERN